MFQLAEIYQNRMTFQRGKDVVFTGTTDKKQKVTISLNGKQLAEKTVSAGEIKIILPPQQAIENGIIEIFTEHDGKIMLKDVDFGEVWIAGGQSNMEFLMRYEQHFKEERQTIKDEHLRFYDVPKYAFSGEEKDGFKEKDGYGVWRHADVDNLKYFSSTGYFFAKKLREKYHVPCAIIGCNWGGTTASAWLDEKLLSEDEELSIYIKEYEEGLKKLDLVNYDKSNYKARKIQNTQFIRKLMDKILMGEEYLNWFDKRIISAAINGEPKPIGPQSESRPGGLYHNMLLKVSGYRCRGVIWYQGESDEKHAEIYAKLFTAMIGCWRREWNENLPFLFVQLAPFGSWGGGTGANYPVLRAQQELVSKTVPNVWMASIMDSGMEFDIHPKNKKVVGERLALLAQGHIYEDEILCDAPSMESAVCENGRVIISVINCGKSLEVRGDKANAFELSVNGIPVSDFKVQVKKDEIILECSKISLEHKIEVRFAYTGFCCVNIYNSANLSMLPFIWKHEYGVEQ